MSDKWAEKAREVIDAYENRGFESGESWAEAMDCLAELIAAALREQDQRASKLVEAMKEIANENFTHKETDFSYLDSCEKELEHIANIAREALRAFEGKGGE